MGRKRATVSVNVETVATGAYDYSDSAGVISLSIIEDCHSDLDVARLLKRLAYMVHPKVDES